MMKEGHLFTALNHERIVGGAIIFVDKGVMYIGRIFVDPSEFKKGYGIAIMKQLESLYPDVLRWKLETPVWSIRTNRFYTKLGYTEMRRDDESVYYQKDSNS